MVNFLMACFRRGWRPSLPATWLPCALTFRLAQRFAPVQHNEDRCSGHGNCCGKTPCGV